MLLAPPRSLNPSFSSAAPNNAAAIAVALIKISAMTVVATNLRPVTAKYISVAGQTPAKAASASCISVWYLYNADHRLYWMRVVHRKKPIVSSALAKAVVNMAFSHGHAVLLKFDARSGIRIIRPLSPSHPALIRMPRRRFGVPQYRVGYCATRFGFPSSVVTQMRKFRYSNCPIVTANVVELMADYVITASGNSNLLRLSVLCLGSRGGTTSIGHFACVVV